MTEEERTRRKELMTKEEENLKKKHDKEYREKMMKTTLKEKYGDYGETVQQRVDGIVEQVNESRSDFEDIMESYMNKLTNAKLLLDEIQKESVDVGGDIRQRMNDLEVCVIRSNFFIANVIQSILSQRETLVFQTPDPFFKIIPMYLWRKFEKHYDNLMMIQKRYPNSETAFRSLLKEKGHMEEYKMKKPKYEYSKYDTLTDEFNQLVCYLECITGGESLGSASSSDTMERKCDRLIRLFSELENDSKKNYNHMKSAINKLKDDIRELVNIHEQAENVYSDMPEGFATLAAATKRGEKKRVELKRCSEELREVSEALDEIRRDLTHLSSSMKQFEKSGGETESVKERRLMDVSSRIQSIFWHLYVVKHLFIPELFSMDTDESSFMKIKDIVKRMNFTSLFKNTYTPMDAKIVLMKYIFEVLLETNDMLDKHIEYSFSIERKDITEMQGYESGGQYMKKRSKAMNKIIDDTIVKTQSNVNQMNILMNELEETFSTI